MSTYEEADLFRMQIDTYNCSRTFFLLILKSIFHGPRACSLYIPLNCLTNPHFRECIHLLVVTKIVKLMSIINGR